MSDDGRTPLPVETTRAGGELDTLTWMLGYYRTVMIRKAEGLTTEQATAQSTPTGLTLLSLIRHLADVERGWFRGFAGLPVDWLYCTEADPDGDFHPGPADTIEEALAAYREQIAYAESVVAGSTLDHVVDDDGELNLRWLLVHMIEETARHAGHADVLRELTDGTVDD